MPGCRKGCHGLALGVVSLPLIAGERWEDAVVSQDRTLDRSGVDPKKYVYLIGLIGVHPAGER